MDYDGENVIQITTEYGYDGGAFYSPEGDRIVWRAWYPSNEEEKEQWKNNLSKKFIESVPLDIYVADTTGELTRFTQLADLVYIGKSILPNTGGQSPIEAASLGKPIVYGPNMTNFSAICKSLEQ